MNKLTKFIATNEKQHKFSLTVVIVTVMLMAFHSINYKGWQEDKIVQNDVIMYYSYLPAIFIHGDMTLNFVEEAQKNGARIWYEEKGNGQRYLKYNAGTAVMMSPFFFVAHGVAHLNNSSTNGYSSTYYLAIVIAAWFYSFIGLFYLRKSLIKIGIRDLAIVLTLLLIGLGTNFFYYGSIESGMSHVYSFCLFSLIFYHSLKWHQRPVFWQAVLIGALIGLATLVRPTNFLIILIPLLSGIYSLSTLKENLHLFSREWKGIVGALIAGGTILMIQPLLWKWGTGEWLIKSYGKEGFFFGQPHIFQGLFSYRKGFFIYAPAMLLVIPGFAFLWRKSKQFFLPLSLFLVITIYVTMSWWCWWYAGGLGMRALTEDLAIMAIPVAFLFHCTINRWTFGLWLGLCLMSIKLNFFFTDSYLNGELSADGMTKKAYWMLLKDGEITGNDWDSYSVPSYYNALLGNDENVPFKEQLVQLETVTFDSLTGEPIFYESQSSAFFLGKYNHAVEFDCDYKVGSPILQEDAIQFVVSLHDYESNENFVYANFLINQDTTLLNHWYHIHFSVPVPYIFNETALLKVYFWNKGLCVIELKNIEVNRLVY